MALNGNWLAGSIGWICIGLAKWNAAVEGEIIKASVFVEINKTCLINVVVFGTERKLGCMFYGLHFHRTY